jgi:hypothetical protein
MFYVVLPLSAETSVSDNITSLDESQQGHNGTYQDFSEATNTWFDPSVHGLGDRPSWADDNCDITSNGLYWFWD